MQELLSRVLEDVDVYSPPVLTTPGWSDGTYWTFVATVQMYIESITGTEAIQNQQNDQGITEFGMSPIEFKDVIKEGYGIVSADGVQRINKGTPETWKFLMPYCGYNMKREQFPIDVAPST